jgi:hypothetical protein
MRRRTLLVALAVVVAAGVVVLWPRANRVTQENYDRIRIGLSRPEVEEILGSLAIIGLGLAKPGTAQVKRGGNLARRPPGSPTTRRMLFLPATCAYWQRYVIGSA